MREDLAVWGEDWEGGGGGGSPNVANFWRSGVGSKMEVEEMKKKIGWFLRRSDQVIEGGKR